MTKNDELQARHQALLDRQASGEAPQSLLADVQSYIEQAKAQAAYIPDSRQRSQLRANLRFWASYVFDQTKTYPDTTLLPASMPVDSTAVSPPLTTITERPAVLKKTWKTIAWALIIGIPLILIVLLWVIPGLSVPATITPGTTQTRPPTVPPESTLPPAFNPITQVSQVILWAKAVRQTGEDCSTRQIKLSYTVSQDAYLANLTAENLSALVTISQAGSEEIAASGDLYPGEELVFTLEPAQSSTSYLVQVDHPKLIFETVIIPFTGGCNLNQASITYAPPLDEKGWLQDMANMEEYLPPASSIWLGWRLLTWGPSPSGDGWVAMLRLLAKGQDPYNIFWASGEVSNTNSLLPSDQVILVGRGCQLSIAWVGVTTGGESLSKPVALRLPDCLFQMP